MMKYLMIISMVAFPTVTNAQMPMTTENRSLGPGTYEEATSGDPPPSDGYRKGWQSSRSSPVMSSGGTGTIPLLNQQIDVPEE